MYGIALRKLFNSTSLAKEYDEKDLNEENIQSIFEKMVYKSSDKMFFYLKYKDQKLKFNDSRIVKTLFEENHKIKFDIFIHKKDSTRTQVDLDKYLNCQSVDDDPVVLNSKDLSSFKDSYSLEYLLDNFSNPEVLD